MARINLLPWREELRKQQKQEFVSAIGLSVLLTVVVLLMVHMKIKGMQEYQGMRNKVIQDEIARLDKKITEVKEIEEKKNTLLTKIEVIQQLQGSRPEIVHLFDELARATPEGIFLTSLKQSGTGLTMEGKAQSNARVSAYMRAIEESPWMYNPKLTVIEGMKKNKKQDKNLSDFSLMATQGQLKSKNEKGDV